ELLPPQLFEIICSYLKDRSFQVVQDGVASSTRNIRAGVPQGSVLGPTLYNLFAHDAPLHLSSERACAATYADDTAVLARSSCIYSATDKLQILLKRFENWACRWNVA
ncbi:hypothetical protein KR059_004534, partial [Drosophila kikkawai]